MKIAHLNSVYHFGSTGRIVEALNLECLAKGYQSTAYYGRKRKDYPNAYFFSTLLNFPIDLAQSFFKDNMGFNSKKVTRKLITKLNDFQPDIIHIHNLHGYYLNLEMLVDYINKHDIKVIMTLHDCWTFTGFQVHFDYNENDDFEYLASHSQIKREYPFRYKVKNNEKNYRLKKELLTSIKNMIIVTPSEYLKKYVDHSFLNKYECLVINNGININDFQYQSRKSNSEKKIILGVASIWSGKKNLSDFIKIIEKLPSDYEGLVVGVNPKQISELPSRVKGITRTDSVEKLVEIYNISYLLLNPTLEDNFPTVNIEALACGLPIVTYDTGGSYEIVEDCGFKVNKGDIDTAVEVILNNDFNKLKDKCVVRANSLYTNRVMIEKYLELYKSLEINV